MTLRKLLFKIICLMLVVSFLLQEFAQAAPEAINWTALHASTLPKLDLPHQTAIIEECYLNAKSPKTLFLIQDAHVNESAQRNIAKTLELIIGQARMKYVFLEAGTGNDSLSFLRRASSQEERKRVGDTFLRKGYIQGPDYFDLTSNHSLQLWGVEDKGLYFKSLDAYRILRVEKEYLNAYLDKISREIATVKPRLCNPSFLHFDEKRRAHLKNEITFVDYFESLAKEGRRMGIFLEATFPSLCFLRKIKTLEVEIDFKKANEELGQAILKFDKDDQEAISKELAQNESLRSSGPRNERMARAFYAMVKEKLMARDMEIRAAGPAAGRQEFRSLSVIPVKAGIQGQSLDSEPSLDSHFRGNDNVFPNLSKYFHYLRESEKINPEKVLEEQEKLEEKVFDSLVRTKDERTLLNAMRSEEILRRIINLKALSSDIKLIEKDPQRFDVSKIAGFLNSKIMELEEHYEDVVFLDKTFDAGLKKAVEFYELTKKRDEIYVDKIFKKMEKEKENRAALVTGGYHTENLKKILKEKNISFISITPQVAQETNQKKYEEILLSPLSKKSRVKNYPEIVNDSIAASQVGVLPGREAMVFDRGFGHRRVVSVLRRELVGARLVEKALSVKRKALSRSLLSAYRLPLIAEKGARLSAGQANKKTIAAILFFTIGVGLAAYLSGFLDWYLGAKLFIQKEGLLFYGPILGVEIGMGVLNYFFSDYFGQRLKETPQGQSFRWACPQSLAVAFAGIFQGGLSHLLFNWVKSSQGVILPGFVENFGLAIACGFLINSFRGFATGLGMKLWPSFNPDFQVRRIIKSSIEEQLARYTLAFGITFINVVFVPYVYQILLVLVWDWVMNIFGQTMLHRQALILSELWSRAGPKAQQYLEAHPSFPGRSVAVKLISATNKLLSDPQGARLADYTIPAMRKILDFVIPKSITAPEEKVFKLRYQVRRYTNIVQARVKLFDGAACVGFIDFTFYIDKKIASCILNNFGSLPYWAYFIGIGVDPNYSAYLSKGKIRYRGIGTSLVGIAFRAAQALGAEEFQVGSAYSWWKDTIGMIPMEGQKTPFFYFFPLQPKKVADSSLKLPEIRIQEVHGARLASRKTKPVNELLRPLLKKEDKEELHSLDDEEVMNRVWQRALRVNDWQSVPRSMREDELRILSVFLLEGLLQDFKWTEEEEQRIRRLEDGLQAWGFRGFRRKLRHELLILFNSQRKGGSKLKNISEDPRLHLEKYAVTLGALFQEQHHAKEYFYRALYFVFGDPNKASHSDNRLHKARIVVRRLAGKGVELLFRPFFRDRMAVHGSALQAEPLIRRIADAALPVQPVQSQIALTRENRSYHIWGDASVAAYDRIRAYGGSKSSFKIHPLWGETKPAEPEPADAEAIQKIEAAFGRISQRLQTEPDEKLSLAFNEFRENGTILLVDSPLPVLFTDSPHRVVRPLHVGRRRNVLYIPRLFLADFQLGNEADEKELASHLLYLMEWLYLYHELQKTRAPSAAIYKELNGLTLNFTQEDRYHLAPRGKVRERLYRLMKQSIIRETVFVVPSVIDEYRRVQHQANRIDQAYGMGYAWGIPETQFIKGLFLDLTRDFMRLGIAFDRFGSSEMAKAMFARMEQYLRLNQASDQGIGSYQYQEFITLLYLRRSNFSKFLEHLETLLTGKDYPFSPRLDKAARQAQLDIVFGFLNIDSLKSEIHYVLSSLATTEIRPERVDKILQVHEKAMRTIDSFRSRRAGARLALGVSIGGYLERKLGLWGSVRAFPFFAPWGDRVINQVQLGKAPAILHEGGNLQCNILLAYDARKKIGCSAHLDFGEALVRNRLDVFVTLSEVFRGLLNMVEELKTEGANSKEIQFMIVNRFNNQELVGLLSQINTIMIRAALHFLGYSVRIISDPEIDRLKFHLDNGVVGYGRNGEGIIATFPKVSQGARLAQDFLLLGAPPKDLNHLQNSRHAGSSRGRTGKQVSPANADMGLAHNDGVGSKGARLATPARTKKKLRKESLTLFPPDITFTFEIEVDVSRFLPVDYKERSADELDVLKSKIIDEKLRPYLPKSWDMGPDPDRYPEYIEIRTTGMGLYEGEMYYRNTDEDWDHLQNFFEIMNQHLPGEIYSVHIHVGKSGDTTLDHTSVPPKRILQANAIQLARIVKNFEAMFWALCGRYTWRPYTQAVHRLRPEALLTEADVRTHNAMINLATEFPTIEVKTLTSSVLGPDGKMDVENLQDNVWWVFVLIMYATKKNFSSITDFGNPILAGQIPTNQQIQRFLKIFYASRDKKIRKAFTHGKEIARRKLDFAGKKATYKPDKIWIPGYALQPLLVTEALPEEVYRNFGLQDLFDIHQRAGGLLRAPNKWLTQKGILNGLANGMAHSMSGPIIFKTLLDAFPRRVRRELMQRFDEALASRSGARLASSVISAPATMKAGPSSGGQAGMTREVEGSRLSSHKSIRQIWLNPRQEVRRGPIPKSQFLRAKRKLEGRIVETPLVRARDLSGLSGKAVLVKLESMQKNQSFKARGVQYEIEEAIEEVISKGKPGREILRQGLKIVTQSTGNHAINMISGVEEAIRSLSEKYFYDAELVGYIRQIEPIIFTLKNLPAVKLRGMLGALRSYRSFVGDQRRGHVYRSYVSYKAAREDRESFIKRHHGRALYMDHGGRNIMIGHGTASVEMIHQLKALGIGRDKKVVLIETVGAGGPVGMIAALKELRGWKNTRGVIVQSARADAFNRTLRTGRLKQNPRNPRPTAVEIFRGKKIKVYFADGAMVDAPEKTAVPYAKVYVDAAVSADERKAYDGSGVILLSDLIKEVGRRDAKVGGTSALTAEALLRYGKEIPAIRDADVVILLATEGNVSQVVTNHLKSKLKDLEEIKAGYEGARHLQNAQARRGAAAPHTDVAESAGARLSTFMSELSPGEIAYFHWKDETVHGEGLGRLLAKEYIDYDMAVKEIINPSDADVIALYGGPGADIINFLLSINTARGYWVDGTVVDARELNRLLKDEWDNLEKSKVALKYLKDKKVDGYGQSYGLRMDDIHLKILLELKMMDVPRESIRVRKRGKHTVLRFDWTYPGKKRSVIK